MIIGFLTGARSEYGIMRNVIKAVSLEPTLEPVIYATGMHYLARYGNTIEEIRKDNYAPIVDVPCYTEEQREKKDDFISLVNALTIAFQQNRPDVLYVIGDRLEAYAGALAAHFLSIPITHFAGGQITKGAVDNIYRYNISNLSKVHFVTNKYALERLQQVPIIDNDTIHLVGSSTVDNIVNYLKSPRTLTDLDERLMRGSYVLMTFHSQTIGTFNVPEAMDAAILTIVSNGKKVLITYPNNDDGSDAIIEVIKKWENNSNVIVIPNLGSEYYYTAIDNSLFVIGNSSSGVIEVPYFSKFTVNVGQRQSGRNAPKSVINTESDIQLLREKITSILSVKEAVLDQEYIYGTGNSIKQIVSVLKSL